MDHLKLVALDNEDLEVLSTHLQDAVLRVGDMAYLPREKKFACIANRFDWNGAGDKAPSGGKNFQRRRTALRFDRVLGAQLKDVDLKATHVVLELLALKYEVSDAPEGHVLLYFAGGATIRLHVECIEVSMEDLGAQWRTKSKPSHLAAGDEESI